MAILRKRKVKVKREEVDEPEAQQQMTRRIKKDMRHFEPDEIEDAIDMNLPEKDGDAFPLQDDQSEAIDDNHVIMKLIKNKTDLLGNEKIELKTLQNQVQTQLKTLESKIKTHYDEIQALEYIASGEPTMTIVDIIDIINDFKNDRNYKTPEEVLNAMERTILKSTLESIRQ